jgi:hypothetical protein
MNGDAAMIETTHGRVRIERSEKRVHTYLDGLQVIDSAHPALVSGLQGREQ